MGASWPPKAPFAPQWVEFRWRFVYDSPPHGLSSRCLAKGNACLGDPANVSNTTSALCCSTAGGELGKLGVTEGFGGEAMAVAVADLVDGSTDAPAKGSTNSIALCLMLHVCDCQL